MIAVLALAVSGCSALRNHYAAVKSRDVGIAAQNQALRDQIHSDPGGGAPTFAPIETARRALARARGGLDSDAPLDQAREALDGAESAWLQLTKPRSAPPDKLVGIADDAHRARRLAQIARYQKQASDDQKQIARLAGAATRGAGSSKLLVPDRLGAIYFQPGSARVKPESRAIISKLAKLVQRADNAGRKIGVAGRTVTILPESESVAAFIEANPKIKTQAKTPDQQTAAYKQALAVTRARDVAQLLIQAGVDGARLGIGIATGNQLASASASGDVIIQMMGATAGSDTAPR